MTKPDVMMIMGVYNVALLEGGNVFSIYGELVVGGRGCKDINFNRTRLAFKRIVNMQLFICLSK